MAGGVSREGLGGRMEGCRGWGREGREEEGAEVHWLFFVNTFGAYICEMHH